VLCCRRNIFSYKALSVGSIPKCYTHLFHVFTDKIHLQLGLTFGVIIQGFIGDVIDKETNNLFLMII
jgi:hypothetical protein